MIILDAGHHRMGLYSKPHWKDTGAFPKNYDPLWFEPTIYNEHHECEKIVTQVGDILRKEGYGTMICPFTYDLLGKIRWESSISMGIKDILVSVHLNASTSPLAKGVEVFYYTGDSKSKKMAQNMSDILSKTCFMVNRGAKEDCKANAGRLGIIQDTKSRAFLIELGFISNKEDMIKMRKYGVQAVVDAIKAIL